MGEKVGIFGWKIYLKSKNFFITSKVLISDGNSDHVAHARRKLSLFGRNPIVTALGLNKCLE